MTGEESKKRPSGLRKVTIMLMEEDHRRLKALYPKGGYNRIIRKLVNNHVRERMSTLVTEVEDDRRDTAEADTVGPVLDGPETDDEGASNGGGQATA